MTHHCKHLIIILFIALIPSAWGQQGDTIKPTSIRISTEAFEELDAPGEWEDEVPYGEVVVADRASENEKQVARVLCDYLDWPLTLESQRRADVKAIFVGNTRYAEKFIHKKAQSKGATTNVSPDAYRIVSDGEHCCLLAPSANGKGLLYAGYHLLELIGFRLYTPNCLIRPEGPTLSLPVCDRQETPSFDYRETLYYYPNHSQLYADWHRLHTRQDMKKDWGMFVHTFQRLVPANKYFYHHPEWFSMIGGKRVRDGQLCLSNPEVLEQLCKSLADSIRRHPDAKIWSVSNNDNYNRCQCPECLHQDSLYGGPSGTLIHFINQVARRFPDKTISTLGYQYTRQAPHQDCPDPQQPDSNVNIMFCSIECGRQEAIPTAPGEAGFRKDMEDWSALTHNIFMWDYVVQFRNFWDPFPNLHVLQPNLRYFYDHGVRQMFEQGSGADNKTSWMELRTYLLAKLMWDVDADADSIIHDFCQGYYGPAGNAAESLYREMCQALIASGKHLDIYGYPIDGQDGYLSPEQMQRYRELMSEGYAALGMPGYELKQESDHTNDLTSRYAERLRYLELSLDFAQMELDMSKGINGWQLTDVADRFVRDCHHFGIENLMEMGVTVDEYRAQVDNYLRKCSRPSLATNHPVTLNHEPDKQYYAGGAKGLTDGIAGIMNYKQCWLGFFGDTLDAVVDLWGQRPVQQISIDFYFFPLSWIFLPEKVEFYISDDRRLWSKVSESKPTNPEILATPRIETITSGLFKRNARYVRIIAYPLPEIPSWHRATGNKCWMFTDEIIVR